MYSSSKLQLHTQQKNPLETINNKKSHQQFTNFEQIFSSTQLLTPCKTIFSYSTAYTLQNPWIFILTNLLNNTILKNKPTYN